MATNLNEDDTQVLDNTLNQKSPSTEALSSPLFAIKPVKTTTTLFIYFFLENLYLFLIGS